MHKIGQKRGMRLQTTQEVATVTKTKYLIDLLFMQEVSTNPSSTHMRRNALRSTADARWQMAWRLAQLPPMAQGNPAFTPAWKKMNYLLLQGKIQKSLSVTERLFLTPPT